MESPLIENEEVEPISLSVVASTETSKNEKTLGNEINIKDKDDEELEEININQAIITNGDDDDDDDDDDEEDNNQYNNGTLIKLPKKYERSFSNYIMISHLITRMGDKSWAFIIPLFLITLSPNSLIPISVFGLSQYLFRLLFGPTIGKMTDKYKKVQIIKLGIFSQAFAIGLSCIILFILFKHVGVIENSTTSSTSSTSTSSSTLFSSDLSIFLFILLLLLSSIHSLATQMMDISVERKWTPSIVKRDSILTKVNTRMRQIDLGTEMLAPFLAGLVAQLCGATAFIWIGVFNFFSFFPQYILLKIVYDRVSVLNLKIDKEGLIDFKDGCDLSTFIYGGGGGDDDDQSNLKTKKSFKQFLMGEWNPFTNIIKGWIVFQRQSVFLVILAYCLLWFTILSPHDSILTAYLSNQGYSYIELSIFRGLGAIFGLGSTLLYNRLLKSKNVFKDNMNKLSLFYILEEGIFVLISGLFFASSLSNWVNKYIFMISIILSRCGLYGFEITEIHYVQRLVHHSERGLVSGVESSLCSLAVLIMFIISSSLQSTNNFFILIWISISFVLTGGLSFFVWFLKYNNIDKNLNVSNI
ncbi:hypothetical protein DDB_G0278675 [Dictyostelium discoideum AX4]|uniref:Solute carrier family 40 member n=1 Tax=Dictyostelium discoideum TaxID=44689 RepID=Q54Y75_DICDI|nr:hypothetical protein DDB_G0278675 [Dictyostelium discoideum AX4]EAL68510.1 hypothetical protein DDB_G0278675 [Dictyostelium discoideum AX4]|eukprot:XP_642327.1 hypothetical protein DDB_G0278675 [Dictyostelium discoideum AX4]